MFLDTTKTKAMNQRAIEFRAWSPKWDKMIYNGVDGYDIDVHAGTIWLDTCDDENPILMQFTGYKDRKGKKIYEGDVLNVGEKTKTKMRIVYDEISVSFCFMYLDNDSYKQKFYGHEEEKYFEVIGNIYKNPELMK